MKKLFLLSLSAALLAGSCSSETETVLMSVLPPSVMMEVANESAPLVSLTASEASRVDSIRQLPEYVAFQASYQSLYQGIKKSLEALPQEEQQAVCSMDDKASADYFKSEILPKLAKEQEAFKDASEKYNEKIKTITLSSNEQMAFWMELFTK